MDNLKSKFLDLLNYLSQHHNAGFHGIGLLVYDSKLFSSDHYCDLRPSIFFPTNLSLNGIELRKYLLTISHNNHSLHDGFHMINEQGILTHVAQYFVPPIRKEITPHQKHGIRVHSAICGSYLKGVIMIGTISSKGDSYIFKNGHDLYIRNKSLKTCP